MVEKMDVKWGLWILGQILAYWGFLQFVKKWRVTQHIYEDSPKAHQVKNGTPTMGGVIMLTGLIIGWLLLSESRLETVWVVTVTILFCLIGMIDDACSILNKTNKGLTARAKFLIQCGVAMAMVGVLGWFIHPLEWYLYGVYVFVLVGSVNATNLTDGLDGLLSSVMLASLIGVLITLHRMQLNDEFGLVLIMIGVIGSFLVWNWYPAKIFMGDTGSLMLGAFLASMCIVSGQWVGLIAFGAVYVIETLSVIVQVVAYKKYHRRVFLMTPLHHHFELIGLREPVIVLAFFLLQLIFSSIKLWG